MIPTWKRMTTLTLTMILMPDASNFFLFNFV